MANLSVLKTSQAWRSQRNPNGLFQTCHFHLYFSAFVSVCVCVCVFIFWGRRQPELTAFRTLCGSSAFVEFVWRRGRCVSLSRIISSFASVCRKRDADRGHLKPGSPPTAALLLLFPFQTTFIQIHSFFFFFFLPLYKSVIPMKCGARWQAVRWGCMCAAVWDYDLSARLSWQTRTPSAWAEQHGARSSRFNFHASSTFPAAAGTFCTSGESAFESTSPPWTTKKLFIIFYSIWKCQRGVGISVRSFKWFDCVCEPSNLSWLHFFLGGEAIILVSGGVGRVREY